MSGKKSGARIKIPEPQKDELKPAGLSDAERIALWRKKRLEQGPIEKKGKAR